MFWALYYIEVSAYWLFFLLTRYVKQNPESDLTLNIPLRYKRPRTWTTGTCVASDRFLLCWCLSLSGFNHAQLPAPEKFFPAHILKIHMSLQKVLIWPHLLFPQWKKPEGSSPSYICSMLGNTRDGKNNRRAVQDWALSFQLPSALASTGN